MDFTPCTGQYVYMCIYNPHSGWTDQRPSPEASQVAAETDQPATAYSLGIFFVCHTVYVESSHDRSKGKGKGK